ncbi:helix-turn-helix domain-containing protein [Actinomadura nitritigenes]|uniref:helix-turn-helix domain-containing protein n=1 Tax=Actinomadura nitritigenes TaxID=134602 RepID=UPI003D8C9AA4
MTNMRGLDPDALTTAELATKLGLSPQTVRLMANAGQIPALKTGKDVRYSLEAVREVRRQPHRQPGDGRGVRLLVPGARPHHEDPQLRMKYQLTDPRSNRPKSARLERPLRPPSAPPGLGPSRR